MVNLTLYTNQVLLIVAMMLLYAFFWLFSVIETFSQESLLQSFARGSRTRFLMIPPT